MPAGRRREQGTLNASGSTHQLVSKLQIFDFTRVRPFKSVGEAALSAFLPERPSGSKF